LDDYLKTTLASNEVPRSNHSWRLLAYMAWSNDASWRNLWMAAQIGTQLDLVETTEIGGRPIHRHPPE